MFKLSQVKSAATDMLDGYKDKDPAAYAAAQEAVGGLLIIDGFIGIDHPLGGKKRSGIFGSLIGLVVGIIFIFSSSLIGGLLGVNKLTATTTGTILSVGPPNVTRNSDGSSSSSCSLSAKYTVNGKEYDEAASIGSSSACGLAAGQNITVNYDPNDPGHWGYNVAGLKTAMKILPFVGVAVAITSLFTFAIRLACIIFGWKILQSGRKLANTLPNGASVGNLVEDLRTEFKHKVFGTQPPSTTPDAPPMPPVNPPVAPAQ